MSTHRSSAAEPWPGWAPSRAAQAAYGEHLGRIAELIPTLLYMYITDRHGLAAAHGARRQDLVDSQVHRVALECRDDLLETAAVLDALALCHVPGSYLPRPYQEVAGQSPAPGVQLRTDASDVADQAVRHDRSHGTSKTGDIPPALQDGCTDAERDAVRAYVRREWLATEAEFADV
ncbi:hypothetical protein [Streptomyces sp. WAC01526]|uniref:hypothetical protein n=1 Tax=Streptomyces sp. WAC01526 TaxID=2588709 RepID=UPI0011DF0FBD|nr:hypothetical protein [Streptomyces sp. WAC01526]